LRRDPPQDSAQKKADNANIEPDILGDTQLLEWSGGTENLRTERNKKCMNVFLFCPVSIGSEESYKLSCAMLLLVKNQVVLCRGFFFFMLC
jgi:hypothetical protein